MTITHIADSVTTRTMKIPATLAKALLLIAFAAAVGGSPKYFKTREEDPVAESIRFLESPILEDDQLLTFCAIADIPYSNIQEQVLLEQIATVPEDCEFLVHLGDFRNASGRPLCRKEEYDHISTIMQKSKVPVFMIVGDNEWNDCPNHEEGLGFWKENFVDFESLHWASPAVVTRQPGRDTSFTFELKGVLFIGLTIVATPIISQEEWDSRLTGEFEWTRELIREYRTRHSPSIGRIVIFMHAEPRVQLDDKFFNPLKEFIENEANDTPIMYMHGDDHRWNFEPGHLSQPNLLRIGVAGEGKEPISKFIIHVDGQASQAQRCFLFDRQLPASGTCGAYCSNKIWSFLGRKSEAIHMTKLGHCFEACSPFSSYKMKLGWSCGVCPMYTYSD